MPSAGWALVACLSAARLAAPVRLRRASRSSAGARNESDAPEPEVLPSFYIAEARGKRCDPEGAWRNILKVVSEHPSRAQDEGHATFSLQCIEWNETDYLALPKRPAQKYYLIWGLGVSSHFPQWSAAMRARKDFIFVSYDRRGGITDDMAPPMPGITFPAFAHNTKSYKPDVPPKYFMTYRGSPQCNFRIKPALRAGIVKSFKHYRDQGVVVEVDDSRSSPEKRHYVDLLNTAYALVPAGNTRWSSRLSDVIEACAIPVIIADGLTLPYEDLIDWSNISIMLREHVMAEEASKESLGSSERSCEQKFAHGLQDPKTLFDQLPRDPDVIRAARKRVCEVRDKYYGPTLNRFESLLKAAAVHAGLPASDRFRTAAEYHMSPHALAK